jgi:hypothetical protein
MNLLARNGVYLGFRPENFLPRDMLDNDSGGVTTFYNGRRTDREHSRGHRL